METAGNSIISQHLDDYLIIGNLNPLAFYFLYFQYRTLSYRAITLGILISMDSDNSNSNVPLTIAPSIYDSMSHDDLVVRPVLFV